MRTTTFCFFSSCPKVFVDVDAASVRLHIKNDILSEVSIQVPHEDIEELLEVLQGAVDEMFDCYRHLEEVKAQQDPMDDKVDEIIKEREENDEDC